MLLGGDLSVVSVAFLEPGIGRDRGNWLGCCAPPIPDIRLLTSLPVVGGLGSLLLLLIWLVFGAVGAFGGLFGYSSFSLSTVVVPWMLASVFFSHMGFELVLSLWTFVGGDPLWSCRRCRSLASSLRRVRSRIHSRCLIHWVFFLSTSDLLGDFLPNGGLG